ncbi:ATP-binding protein [Streptomyces albulus]|nr:ATP-binding protein [Streptomyces noursei]
MAGLHGEQSYAGSTWTARLRIDPALLEREAEQAQLKQAMAEIGEGQPAVVVVTGRPGFGHNALLRWAGRLAEKRSVRVLRATGSLTERDLRNGAVIQLLSQLGPEAEGPLRVLRGPPEPDGLPGLRELLHTVRRRPTLVTVEDAQWLDPDSRRWLQALVRRLSAGVPSPCSSAAPGGPARPRLAGRHLRRRTTDPPPPRPRTEPRAVATLAGTIFGAPCDEAFADAAAEASYGSPAILHAALHGLADAGQRPTAADVPQLRTVMTSIIGDRCARALRA